VTSEPADIGVEALLGSIRDAVIVGDAATRRILLWNPASEALFGYSAAEARDLVVEDLVPSHLKEQCRAGLARYARTGRSDILSARGVLEIPALKKNGDEFTAEIMLSPLHNGSAKGRLVVATVRDITDRKRLERQFEELSWTDGLTGVANRRRFDALLDEEWRRAGRDETALALVMIDIDHFKDYNDVLGHPAGDDALRNVAQALVAIVRRAGEVVARYGGEEFAVLLPHTTLPVAMDIGEALRSSVESLRIPHPTRRPTKYLTISAGVAAAEPLAGSSAAELVARADQALYKAKRRGRNRVESADKP